MEDILNMLYRGEIHPEENYRPILPELIEARKEYAGHRDALYEELDEPIKEKVEALLEERTFVTSYEIEDAYVQGMRLGAKIAAALLKNKDDE